MKRKQDEYLAECLLALKGVSGIPPRDTPVAFEHRLAFLKQHGIYDDKTLCKAFPTLRRSDKHIALSILGARKYRSAIPLFFDVLEKAESEMPMATIAIALIGGASVVSRLCYLGHQSKNWKIRACAVDALCHIDAVDYPRMALRISDSLRDIAVNTNENADIRSSAIEALSNWLGPIDKRTRYYRDIIQVILHLLQDRKSEVRASTAYTLGVLRVHSALGELRRLAKTDNTRAFRTLKVNDEARAAIANILCH